MYDDHPTPVHPLPIASPVREPPSPGPWAEFTAWPGSTSLVTLLSAALLFAGLYGVLEPALAEESYAAPRWQVLGTLSAYLAALLSGIWAMCRARSGNPDAVASTVVGVACAVGFGVVIQLIAPTQPGLALGAGLMGWVGLLLLGFGFARCTAAPWRGPGWSLAVVLAWTTVWPVVLSAGVVGEAVKLGVGRVDGGTDAAVMVWWTAGWGVLLVMCTGVLVQVMFRRDREDGQLPFLQRSAMRWSMLLLALGLAVIVLLVQAHIAGLDVAATDILPHLVLLLMIANEWRAQHIINPIRDATAVLAAAAIPVVLTMAGNGPDMSSQFRGQGWAPDLVGGLGTAPVAPLFAAVVAMLLAWSRPGAGLYGGAVGAIILAVLAWDPREVLLAESACLAGAVGAVVAWRADRPDWAVAATALAGGCIPVMRWAAPLIGYIPDPILMLAASSGIVLATATWRPNWVLPSWARIAAWVLGILAAAVALELLYGRRQTGRLPGGSLTGILILTLVLPAVGLCAWRRRDGGIASAMLPAGLVISWPLLVWLMPATRAWLVVWGAFVALVAGVWLAVRRARA